MASGAACAIFIDGLAHAVSQLLPQSSPRGATTWQLGTPASGGAKSITAGAVHKAPRTHPSRPRALQQRPGTGRSLARPLGESTSRFGYIGRRSDDATLQRGQLALSNAATRPYRSNTSAGGPQRALGTPEPQERVNGGCIEAVLNPYGPSPKPPIPAQRRSTSRPASRGSWAAALHCATARRPLPHYSASSRRVRHNVPPPATSDARELPAAVGMNWGSEIARASRQALSPTPEGDNAARNSSSIWSQRGAPTGRVAISQSRPELLLLAHGGRKGPVLLFPVKLMGHGHKHSSHAAARWPRTSHALAGSVTPVTVVAGLCSRCFLIALSSQCPGQLIMSIGCKEDAHTRHHWPVRTRTVFSKCPRVALLLRNRASPPECRTPPRAGEASHNERPCGDSKSADEFPSAWPREDR
ncbi:hypothetical protein CC78DRAFT_594203 [Lojkania enalia]|uniref:Uncharacterized protein n=1 Tax=Lojkania enalia TaxID=147567 RepID=A0A9P4N8W9_9PLEO|nr:hypothetical protein CC78DRAFT_594203 [Didymosphaeria enalia]